MVNLLLSNIGRKLLKSKMVNPNNTCFLAPIGLSINLTTI